MSDNHGHLERAEPLQDISPECPESGKILISPLGWGIKGRLIWAVVASAVLWLSVAWAIGWP